MKNGVKTWTDRIFDPFNIQFYFIVCTFFVEIPLLMGYMGWWKAIGLVWAALAILYDLCTRRRCLRSRGAALALGLLVSYLVTTAAVRFRFPEAFHETYLDLFCSAAALLVMYPPLEKRRQERLRILDRVLILLVTAASAVGIAMFLLQIGGYYYSPTNDYDYPVGFVGARLTGLYRNAIYPTPLIGVGAALIEWPRSKGKGSRLLLGLSLLINCWHVLLSNSKGLLYTLALMGALVTLLWILRRLAGAAPWKRWGAGLLASLMLAGCMLGLAAPARQASAYLPTWLRQAVRVQSPFSPTPTGGAVYVPPSGQSGSSGQSGPVDMERQIPEAYGALTGRPKLWKMGWELFLQRPVFGYGPYALKDEIRIIPNSKERLSHFHNLGVQSLVSLGTVGTLFLMGLLAVCVLPMLKRLFTGPDSPDYPELAGLAVLILALLFLNLADVTVFFLSKNSEFVFWTYLGSAVALMGNGPLRSDRPLQRLSGRLPRFGD